MPRRGPATYTLDDLQYRCPTSKGKTLRPFASVLVALSVSAGAPVAAQKDAPSPADPRLRALSDVYDGRFDRARSILAGPASDPGDPRTPFFLAYVDYWALIYDPDDRLLRERFEANLLRTLDLADGLPPDRAADAGTWVGTAHLLLAQLRAWERRSVAAAFEAGRSKRTLERVARADPDLADPLFALGTYNYMADRVSTFVKGLRALLFLPGGDERLGLRQLERAASESTHFRLDARLLLVTVYSHRKERRYDDALREMTRALRDAGDTVAVRYAAARLDLTLARPERAFEHLAVAEDLARRDPEADRSVRAALSLLGARAEFAILRPDLAAERLAALLAEGEALPRSTREDAATLLSEAKDVLASPAWSRVREAITGPASESPSFPVGSAVRLAERHPSDPAAALVAGRALLAASAPQEAWVWLERAEASAADLPASWVGPCRLLAARALDLQGRREEALVLYRKAAESAPFTGREAAHHGQAAPFRMGT
jgi:tetratricopeptide (TPR) repeat protein